MRITFTTTKFSIKVSYYSTPSLFRGDLFTRLDPHLSGPYQHKLTEDTFSEEYPKHMDERIHELTFTKCVVPVNRLLKTHLEMDLLYS